MTMVVERLADGLAPFFVDCSSLLRHHHAPLLENLGEFNFGRGAVEFLETTGSPGGEAAISVGSNHKLHHDRKMITPHHGTKRRCDRSA